MKTSKEGPKEIFWTKFRNLSQKSSIWSPFKVSIESRQKSLKNYDFCWKKNLSKILGISPKNVHLIRWVYPSPPEIWKFSELAPLALGTLRNSHYNILILCVLTVIDSAPRHHRDMRLVSLEPVGPQEVQREKNIPKSGQWPNYQTNFTPLMLF